MAGRLDWVDDEIDGNERDKRRTVAKTDLTRHSDIVGVALRIAVVLVSAGEFSGDAPMFSRRILDRQRADSKKRLLLISCASFIAEATFRQGLARRCDKSRCMHKRPFKPQLSSR